MTGPGSKTGQTQIRVRLRRRPADCDALDLRTPSGRLLPY